MKRLFLSLPCRTSGEVRERPSQVFGCLLGIWTLDKGSVRDFQFHLGPTPNATASSQLYPVCRSLSPWQLAWVLVISSYSRTPSLFPLLALQQDLPGGLVHFSTVGSKPGFLTAWLRASSKPKDLSELQPYIPKLEMEAVCHQASCFLKQQLTAKSRPGWGSSGTLVGRQGVTDSHHPLI